MLYTENKAVTTTFTMDRTDILKSEIDYLFELCKEHSKEQTRLTELNLPDDGATTQPGEKSMSEVLVREVVRLGKIVKENKKYFSAGALNTLIDLQVFLAKNALDFWPAAEYCRRIQKKNGLIFIREIAKADGMSEETAVDMKDKKIIAR